MCVGSDGRKGTCHVRKRRGEWVDGLDDSRKKGKDEKLSSFEISHLYLQHTLFVPRIGERERDNKRLRDIVISSAARGHAFYAILRTIQ